MPPSIAPARWVITGAGGFVARHLLPLLPGAAALARPGGARPGADARVSDLLDVDLLDAGGVRAALRALAGRAPIAGLVHLGGAASGGAAGPAVHAINVDGALHVADALWAVSPGAALLQLSTGYVYGERQSPADEDAPLEPIGDYARSKAAAERALVDLAQGRRLLRLRAFNHAGPGQGPGYALPDWGRALAGGAARLQTGWLGAVRDVSDVRELAAGIALLTADPGGWPPVLNACSGQAWTMQALLARLVALRGGPPPVIEAGEAGRGGLRESRGSRARADRLGLPRPRPIDQTLADLLRPGAP
jgi:GDP-4-dehydro-6-deoxy-D-mannose reductase